MLKQDLRKYRWIRMEIRQLEEQQEKLRSEAESQCVELGREPGSNRIESRLEKIVIKIVELNEKIQQKLMDGYELMHRIEAAISILPEREAYLIRARYIELKSWEQIAVDMNYSWRQVHYIHAGALKLLADK